MGYYSWLVTVRELIFFSRVEILTISLMSLSGLTLFLSFSYVISLIVSPYSARNRKNYTFKLLRLELKLLQLCKIIPNFMLMLKVHSIGLTLLNGWSNQQKCLIMKIDVFLFHCGNSGCFHYGFVA